MQASSAHGLPSPANRRTQNPEPRTQNPRTQHPEPRTAPKSVVRLTVQPGPNFPAVPNTHMPSLYDKFKLVSDFELKGDQARAIPELVRGAQSRRPEPGAAGRHRLRQDLHDGEGHRGGEPADARDGAQQDPGGAALSGIPSLLPGERGRVLRQLLRLLPARGLRSVDRFVHRERSDHQRRDRSHAPVGDPVALRAPRRHHRLERVVHLRPGIARGVLRHAAAAAARPAHSARSDSPQARRDSVRAQRDRLLARHLPRARRRHRGLSCRTKSRRCASSCSATTSTR